MTPQQMATQWLRVWLDGVGVHGLQPAPGEPLVRWLLVLHERAAIEEQIATEGLEAHHAAAIDQLREELIATQRDTLPPEAQDAVRAGNILAVRAAETAAIVWTLAALDAIGDPSETITGWRIRLRHCESAAQRLAEERPSVPISISGSGRLS